MTLHRTTLGDRLCATTCLAGPVGSSLIPFLFVLASLAPAQAVVLNDKAANEAGGIGNYYDRDNVYSSVAALVTGGGANCTGSLINARTILTAAHCVEHGPGQLYISNDNTYISFSPIATQPNPNNRLISGVAAHAQYNHGPLNNDIALISLAAPVTDLTPVKLVKAGDPLPPVGTVIRMVGYGASGTGSNPPYRDTGPYDDKRRVGETLFGGYLTGEEAGMTGNKQRYIMGQFEDPAHPDDPVGPLPHLQAGAAPGDSGGPLFVVTEGGLVQIGVADWVVNYDAPQFGYGSVTGWTSVADYLGWIDQHNALRQVRARAGDHVWSDRSAWSDTATGSGAVPNNRDGHFRGAGAIGRYYQVALTQPGTMTLDMNATIDSLWIGGEQSALSLPRGRELAAILGTELSDGRLAVDGTLSTGLLDISGGTLSGTGRIVTPFGVANKGGVVAPGSATAPGVLTVQGRYVQTDMGILAIRVRDGDSSRLSVEQTATLGGTLHVSGRVDPLHQNTTAQVLTAGAVEGRFARVTDSFAFFDPSLTYGSRAVTMNLARNGLAFADIGLTGNERAAGAAAEALAPTHQVYGAILQLDETSARGAFGNLAGDIHASARGVLLDTSRYVRDAATNRMRQTFTGDGSLASLSAPPGTVQTPHGTTVGLWGQGFGSWGRNTDRAHAGIDTSTGGFLLGADSLAGDGWRVGIAGGYSQTSFDTDRTVSSGTSDNYHVAAYGGRQWGPLGVRLGSALSWHSIGVNRQVVFPGFSDTLVSDRDGRTAQIFGEVGYGLALGTAALEPFAALAHVNLHTDGLTETGGAAALNARGGSANTTFSTLGVRVANRIALSETTALTVRGTLGWRHAFGDVEPAALMTFQDGAFPFGVTGAPVARDALVVEAGLDLAVGPAATLGVSYSGQISGRTQDQTVKGDLTWKF